MCLTREQDKEKQKETVAIKDLQRTFRGHKIRQSIVKDAKLHRTEMATKASTIQKAARRRLVCKTVGKHRRNLESAQRVMIELPSVGSMCNRESVTRLAEQQLLEATQGVELSGLPSVVKGAEDEVEFNRIVKALSCIN